LIRSVPGAVRNPALRSADCECNRNERRLEIVRSYSAARGVVVEERGPTNAGRFQMVAKPVGQAIEPRRVSPAMKTSGVEK
jgi:hypothetical protein